MGMGVRLVLPDFQNQTYTNPASKTTPKPWIYFLLISIT